MRKQLLLLMFTIVLFGIANIPVNAQCTLDKQSLVNQGYSKYFADITLLMKDRNQCNVCIEKPSEGEIFVKNMLWGDWAAPTQEFGYFDISPR